jgi:putative membrane-bound dehydrogenase-like protein
MRPARLLAVLSLLPFAAWAEFPAPYNSEKDPSAPMPPAEAAAKMKLPPGFMATVFAAEPDVQNPIAMTFDGKGRIWVAENYTYAEAPLKFELKLRDRVVIFTEGKDGHFAERKVFTDDLQMLTSIEVGRGGVWAMCPPQLLFIPDRNRDDVPDSGPHVMLDGFTVPVENFHNFANGLRWGPDGWLYGRCGGSAPGEVGLPGTPAEQRVPMRGGMWRFHPERKIFETLAAGTTNPWGHDWDENGELFHVNTVNGHLWHVVPGMHFVRGSSLDPNPHVYSLIDTHADHWHFDTGKSWTDSRAGAANSYGGGHAHIGCMIYQGDNWPAEYRGKLFTLNQHGKRANMEILERQGSGYVGKHGPDFMISPDPWFVGMDLQTGPDGGVYVLDWSDTGECHDRNGVHRTSGRIYKIAYGKEEPYALRGSADLTQLPGRMIALQLTKKNAWFARQAQIEFATRTATGRSEANEVGTLQNLGPDANAKLEALWTGRALRLDDRQRLQTSLLDGDEHVRAWAIRLLTDYWPLDLVTSKRPARFGEVKIAGEDFEKQAAELAPEFTRMAREDSSALVRLVLASTLQRMPYALRAQVAEELVKHAEDANDHNLPLMIWYGLIPLGESDPMALARVGAKCEIPLTRRYIARRLAEDMETKPEPLNELLKLSSAAQSAEIAAGIGEALVGWRKAPKPAAWDEFSKKLPATVDVQKRELDALFGSGRALDEIKQTVLNKDTDMRQRQAALRTLIDARPPDLRQICREALKVRFLNPYAARGLATIDDPAIGEELVAAYKSFYPTERPQLIATLVSRPAFAKALLDAIAKNKIPRDNLSAFDARAIRNFNDDALTQRLVQVWGELRDSAADKRQAMTEWKAKLTPDLLAKADLLQGRANFTQVCGVCHTLYGEGGKIGPDLTGAGRDNLDYLLENIIDPSAVVSADFRMSIVTLKDGRVVSGMIRNPTPKTFGVQTMTDLTTIDRGDVGTLQEMPLSLMPEGLLSAFSETQVRDLIAYLMHRGQVGK